MSISKQDDLVVGISQELFREWLADLFARHKIQKKDDKAYTMNLNMNNFPQSRTAHGRDDVLHLV
jgi:hypothetical protein